MNINKINCIKYNNYPVNSIKETETTGTVGVQQEQLKDYRPYSYMDYNINFGARLFRTPANFYAQPFNQKGMPITMKNYLEEDYEDRQNMPPAQMMREAFKDIENANSLEEVKKLYSTPYPEEPLFQNLHDVDYSKFRTGTLGDIFALKDDKHPLFKDGSDDLGMYLLKKIYLECKTMKEIVPDFRKDITEYYKDVADIDYSTIRNFGISYPDNGFWKSLTATREEFPYTYTPRKDAKTRNNNPTERTLRDIVSDRTRKKYPEKPKYDIPEHELDKMTDAILNSGGNVDETNRELKKKGFRGEKNDPKRTFICQYLGPIMSITLDRIHASDEMREFFENYDANNKSMKKRMDAYWREHPDMKELQSLIMSDTIKLFFETYGADGENEYFRELLEYANSIKPNRISQEKELAERTLQLQQYYEALFNELEAQEELPITNWEDFAPIPKVNEPVEKGQEQAHDKVDGNNEPVEEERKHFEEMKRLNNLKEYQIKGPNGQIFHIAANLDNAIRTIAHIIWGDILPEKYIDLYADFVNNSKLATEEYKIAMQVKGFIPDQKENPKELIKYVMSDEKILEINSKLEEEFLKKYPNESRALVFAAVEAFAPFFEQIKNLDNLVKLYQFSPFTLYTLFSDFKKDEGIKYFTDERIKCIPKIYDRITARCNNSEIQNAAYNIEKSLNNYDPRYLSQQLGKDRNQLEVMNTYTIASIVKSGNRNKILELRKVIIEHLKKHNYEAKAIQADGLPNLVMTVALEKIVTHIASENPEKIQKILQSK